MNETTQKRYSDEELEEFRVLITDKLEKARQEYRELMGTTEDNSESEDTASISNTLEAGVDFAQRAEIKRLADRQLQFIQKLESALARVKNKTYGVCRVTGNLIPKERLRAVPHATLSIEAKNR